LQLVGSGSDEDQAVHIENSSYPIEVISRIDFGREKSLSSDNRQ